MAKLGRLKAVSWMDVRLTGGMWGQRQRVNRERTLPMQYEKCADRIRALELDWRPGSKLPKPHIFWDSDLGKWIEAAAYSLGTRADRGLERRADGVIEKLVGIQMKDGYLNSHFQQVRPKERWTNLRDEHELYCAGHLIEAAVAYYRATGKRKLVDAMCRYADHIGRQFGRKRGQKRGYPGHEEIELALVKLFGVTGEGKYLELAKYFVDERGREPHYFTIEAKKRKDARKLRLNSRKADAMDYTYWQAHESVRSQRKVVGHSVRAMYFLSGAADVAGETGDKELLGACKRLWRNLVSKRMYITGGIGSTHVGERFTLDYDLPNETAYAETCAAIGLVFFAHRMVNLEADGEYADVMERALYNGVISGVSLSGERFFYDNYLASYPGWHEYEKRKAAERQEWFECACCPPNLARLMGSLGGYVYSVGRDELFVHLYMRSEMETEVGGKRVRMKQRTEYPWEGKVQMKVEVEEEVEFGLAMRVPGWCGEWKVRVNGKRVREVRRKGYAYVRRRWRNGERVELEMEMGVEVIEAHPAVRADRGRVALQRGPVVYCLEEVDNGKDLNALVLKGGVRWEVGEGRGKLAGMKVLRGKAYRETREGWGGKLYKEAGGTKRKPVRIRAVPYFAWANRGEGEMVVWIRECGTDGGGV